MVISSSPLVEGFTCSAKTVSALNLDKQLHVIAIPIAMRLFEVDHVR